MSDNNTSERNYKQIIKITLPHLILLVVSFVYTIIGATFFMRVEMPHLVEKTENNVNHLQVEQQKLLNRIAEIKNSGGQMAEADRELSKYIEEVYKLYQTGLISMADVERKRKNLTAKWDAEDASFFGLTALSTIGYGNIVPVSEKGKIFFICYAIIGVPLLLITTADLAKFLTNGINYVYLKLLAGKQYLYERIKNKFGRQYSVRRKEARHEQDLETDDDSMAEYLWAHLENVQEVQIHAPFIFLVILAFSSLGGLLFMNVEPWSFFDSFYFSFISCMKIGFGDMVPENNLWLALIYSFLGLTVATMCIDAVGFHYLERLHQFGRRMTTADYLKLMKDAKAKKKRKEAIHNHYNTLMLLTQMEPPQKDQATPESVVEPEAEPEIREPTPPGPPSAPSDLRVVDLTPYSIKLAWTPPSENSQSEDTSYVLQYRMKHTQRLSVADIKQVVGGEFEIKGLKSFSIYELNFSAVNSLGRSDSIKLIQITEPETSPQKLLAEQLTATTVKLQWQAPWKKKKDIESYAVYYTTNVDTSFEKWQKVLVSSSNYSLTLENLDEATKYSFCISSVYDKGHSPISKTVSMMTGFLNGSPDTISSASITEVEEKTVDSIKSNEDNKPDLIDE